MYKIEEDSMFKNNKGYSHILLVLIVLGAVLAAGYIYLNKTGTNISYLDTYSIEDVAGASTSECTNEIIVGANEKYTTINDAVASIKNNAAGKVICVRNNKTYDATKIDASGAVGNPLVIRSHPSNTGFPKISVAGAYPTWQARLSGKTALVITGDNIVLDGFEVARATGSGIAASYVENVTISNVSAHDTYEDGLQVLHSKNVNVTNCKLYNNEMIGTVTDCLKQHPNACKIGEVLKVRFSDGVKVENCVITDDKSPHRGGVLNMGDSKNLIIRNNDLYKHDGNNLHMGGAENVLVENNVVYGICGFEGKGLYRNAERQPADANAYDYPGKNITVRNNLIVGMRAGLYFGGCEVKKEPKGEGRFPWIASDLCQFENVQITNNTVVGIGAQLSDDANDESKEFALYLDSMQGDPVRNVVVQNNIFHSTDDGNGYAGDFNDRSSGTKTFVNNIWSDNKQAISATDREIPGLAGVFANDPNLDRCLTGYVDPQTYRTSAAFNGKGADVTKVGADNSGISEPPAPQDNDGDGVSNEDDICPETRAGATPDPTKPGCPLTSDPQPETDEDGDGVPDSADQCRNIPTGDYPHPSKLGCPAEEVPTNPDSDNDGVENSQDMCITKPAGTNPDPAKPGCPKATNTGTTPVPTGINVLFNPQFSLPARNRLELARQWFYSDGKLGKMKVELVKVPNSPLARDYAAKITLLTRPTMGYVSLNQQNIKLQPNTKYQLIFSAKSSANTELITTFVDMGFIETSLAPKVTFKLSDSWKQYKAEFTTTNFDPKKLAKVTFGYKGAQGSELYLDNVYLRTSQ